MAGLVCRLTLKEPGRIFTNVRDAFRNSNHIILGLRIPQLVVFPALVVNQRIVIAALDQRTLMKYGDIIAESGNSTGGG